MTRSPSAAATAVLLNVRGLAHEARGDFDSAFASHQEAHETLMDAPASSLDEARSRGWLQACRAGSEWALLRQGATHAAHVLARADLAEHQGGYFYKGRPHEPAAWTRDERLASELWARSVQLVGLDTGNPEATS